MQDRSVRIDLLMNLMFVDGLIYAPREAPDDIGDGEEVAVLSGLRRYFGSSPGGISGLIGRDENPRGVILDKPNRVLLDGVEVAPLEVSFTIVRPAPETRPGFEQNPLLLIPQIHLVLEYGCKQPPTKVELQWGTFPLDFLAQGRDTPPPVEIEAQLTAEGEIYLVTFTSIERGFTWHGTGRSIAQRMSSVPEAPELSVRVLPAASALVVASWIGFAWIAWRRRGGRAAMAAVALMPVVMLTARSVLEIGEVPLGAWAGRLGSRPEIRIPRDAEAREIFTLLQNNVYRAFDYTTEPEIYDALARSVDGPLLDAMYNDVYRSLVMYEEGGAVSRVKSVQPIETTIVDGLPRKRSDGVAFDVLARWRLEGVVYHWGHSHTRVNEYLARFRVAASQTAGWRIVSAQTIEQFRVDPLTGATAITPASPEMQEEPAWHPTR
ncbi:MAG: hypothetical protein H7210_08825 [Pyrinomonadaceae bacterium]|nr:hypothetical protein [Phycisphaerales bacterium]